MHRDHVEENSCHVGHIGLGPWHARLLVDEELTTWPQTAAAGYMQALFFACVQTYRCKLHPSLCSMDRLRLTKRLPWMSPVARGRGHVTAAASGRSEEYMPSATAWSHGWIQIQDLHVSAHGGCRSIQSNNEHASSRSGKINVISIGQNKSI